MEIPSQPRSGRVMTVKRVETGLLAGTRTILTKVVSGSGAAFSVRCTDCQPKLFASIGVSTLTAELSLPSRPMPEASIIHFAASKVHRSSPNPPLASKCQETMARSLGFQPMICTLLTEVLSAATEVIVLRMKFF